MTFAQTAPVVQPSPEEIYQTLLRVLRRKKGFGLVFVQCSPAKAARLITEVQRDLPQKKIANLSLTEPIDNLYSIIEQRSDKRDLNILFIQGLEKSLESDIKPGYGGDGSYYNLDTVPRILSHLNQQRENFRDRFNNICFVFILPLFGVKYFIRRAPDFFDWVSGVFEIPTERELIEQEMSQILERFNAQADSEIAQEECKRRILEIQSWIDEPFCEDDQKIDMLLQQGDIFKKLNEFESALSSYKQVLKIKPDNIFALFSEGLSLSNLDRYEESIESYERVLVLQPDHYKAWSERGDSLVELGRYEEAITSYKKALYICPNSAWVWDNYGYTLRMLGRDQEAIKSLEKALAIEPDNHNFWNRKGIVQCNSGLYKESLKSLSHAIELNPDFYYAWANRGDTLKSLGEYKQAIESYNKAIEIDSDNYYAWFRRARILCQMGHNKDGIASYEKVLEIDPDHRGAHHNRALALSGIGQYQEAVIGFRKAIELNSEPYSGTAWMCLGATLKSLRRYQESLACFDKAIELGNSGYFEWGGRAIVLFRLGCLREAFFSAYKACQEFRTDKRFRDWLEYRIAAYLRQFGLQKLAPVWVWFLNLIGWRVKNW